MNPLLRTSAAHLFVDSIETPIMSDDDAHHVVHVLRVRSNETVSVSDGAGKWRLCVLKDTMLTPATEVVTENAPKQALTVAIAPVKGDRTEWAVEKLVEVGIDSVAILEPTERSVVRWTPEKMATNIERLRRIAKAAAMQSRRVWLPQVVGPVVLADVLANDGVALADPDGGELTGAYHTVVIGPEGGFSDGERREARAVVSLGANVLRADTAAVVAGTMMVTAMSRASDHTV